MTLANLDISPHAEALTPSTRALRDVNRPANLLDFSGREVQIGGYSLSRWLGHFRLPLHIGHLPRVRENIRAFRGILNRFYPKRAIHFAAKAYPCARLFSVVRNEQEGLEVCSLNELRCGLDMDFSPEKIVISGNCKERELLDAALEMDIVTVVDSEEELRAAALLARSRQRRLKVLLRICGLATGNATDECILTSGKWTKFGIPLEDIPSTLDVVRSYPELELLGTFRSLGKRFPPSMHSGDWMSLCFSSNRGAVLWATQA